MVSDHPIVITSKVKTDLLFLRDKCCTELIQVLSVKVRVPWPRDTKVKVTIERLEVA